MKDAFFIFLSLGFFLVLIGPSFAGEEDELPPGISELPPGMEIIKVGTANLIVPAGSRVYQENTVLIVEPVEQYAARRFLAMEGRFARIEAKQEKLQKVLDGLKKILEDMQKDR